MLRLLPVDVWTTLSSYLKSRHCARLEMTGDVLVRRALRYAWRSTEFDYDVPATDLVTNLLLGRGVCDLRLSDAGWRNLFPSVTPSHLMVMKTPLGCGVVKRGRVLDIAALAPCLRTFSLEVAIVECYLKLPLSVESVSVTANYLCDEMALFGLSSLHNLSELSSLTSLTFKLDDMWHVIPPYVVFPLNLAKLTLTANAGAAALLPRLLPASIESLHLSMHDYSRTIPLSSFLHLARLSEFVVKGGCSVLLDAIPQSLTSLRLAGIKCAGSTLGVFSQLAKMSLARLSFDEVCDNYSDDEWPVAMEMLLPTLACRRDAEHIIATMARHAESVPNALGTLVRFGVPAEDVGNYASLLQSKIWSHTVAEQTSALCDAMFGPRVVPDRLLREFIQCNARHLERRLISHRRMDQWDPEAAFEATMRVCALIPTHLDVGGVPPQGLHLPDDAARNIVALDVQFTNESDLRALLSSRLDRLGRLYIAVGANRPGRFPTFTAGQDAAFERIAAVIVAQRAKTMPSLDEVIVAVPEWRRSAFEERMSEIGFYARPSSIQFNAFLARPSWATVPIAQPHQS